jgi:hypothetical protein
VTHVERLLELEVGEVLCAVNQRHDQLATGVRLALLRLPHVGVDAAGGVVLQAAVARRHRLFHNETSAAQLAESLIGEGKIKPVNSGQIARTSGWSGKGCATE